MFAPKDFEKYLINSKCMFDPIWQCGGSHVKLESTSNSLSVFCEIDTESNRK